MRWSIAAAALVAATAGAIAITLGLARGSTPGVDLIVTYLINISTTAFVGALVLWALDKALAVIGEVKDEVRAATLLVRSRRDDDDSSPRISRIRN